jgi:hypothetical protein
MGIATHPRASSQPCLQVPIRRQVPVGLDHDATGNGQLDGQDTRGRQRRAWYQLPPLNAAPQRRFEPLANTRSLAVAYIHEQVTGKA